MGSLKDLIIFLTGGASGIGYACAKAYVAAGATVVVVDKNETSLREVQGFMGPDHLYLCADVSVESEVAVAIDATLSRFGRLDAIHNNAGVTSPSKALHDTTAKEWDLIFDVNLKGIFHTCKFGIDALIASEGSVLNTSSLVGQIGQQDHAAYVASKGAIDALTKSMAIDYAPYKVRVNAVSPAAVWTPALREWSREQHGGTSQESYLDDIHLLGYCPEADVIADACVFLLSRQSRFITGHILPVSGGAELGYRRKGKAKENV